MPSRSVLDWVKDLPEGKNKPLAAYNKQQGVIFMAETYDIMCDASPVGKAQVKRQGLYYCFSCRCRLPDSGIYRIHVCCGENCEDLGICIPLDGMFGMDKRVAAKYLGEGTMSFHLHPRDWKPQPVIAEQEPVPEEKPEDEEKLTAAEISIPAQEEEGIPAEQDERFIPVSEDEPFDYLDELENAVMEVRGEQIGIVLHKQE